MALDTYALITVEEYLSYRGMKRSDLKKDGLLVYCSATDATAATVAKSGSTLTLTITGGADAGSVPLTLTDAANDTLGELQAVIDGTSGWSCDLLGYGAADSVDLLDFDAVSCVGVDDAETLEYYDDYTYENFINRATGLIEARLCRPLKERTWTHDRYTGRGAKLFLDTWPIAAVERVAIGDVNTIRVKNTTGAHNAYAKVSTTGVTFSIDGVAGSEFTFASYATMTLLAAALNGETGWEAVVPDSTKASWPSSLLYPHPNYFALDQETFLMAVGEPFEGYECDYDRGILYLPSGFNSFYLEVFVTWTGGHSTLPYDIQDAACRLVSLYDNRRKIDETMKSEKLADYSYTRTDSEVQAEKDILDTIMHHRRVML